MSKGASLNPDPMEMDDEDEDANDGIAFDPTNRLQMFERMLNNDDGHQFDDDDDDNNMQNDN